MMFVTTFFLIMCIHTTQSIFHYLGKNYQGIKRHCKDRVFGSEEHVQLTEAKNLLFEDQTCGQASVQLFQGQSLMGCAIVRCQTLSNNPTFKRYYDQILKSAWYWSKKHRCRYTEVKLAGKASCTVQYEQRVDTCASACVGEAFPIGLEIKLVSSAELDSVQELYPEKWQPKLT